MRVRIRMGYRRLTLLFLVLVMCALTPASAWAAAGEKPNPAWETTRSPHMGAWAAVLMDYTTGQILYEKNAHVRRDPASTTKVLTALVLLEQKGDQLSELVKISRRAAYTPGSTMGIRPGEVYSLHDLLHGLLMRSGNDAAVAIAEAVSGSVDNFSKLMNAKAREIGALKTHFTNPHGLSDSRHFTTAYDLALITREAMQNEAFRSIVSLRKSDLTYEQLHRDVVLHNTNRLLYSLPGADGVKTGTTAAAGPCLISSATRDGQKLISVVLHAGNRWSESARLLEWGFDNFQLHHVARAGDHILSAPVWQGRRRSIGAVVDQDVVVVAPRRAKELPAVSVHVDPQLAAPVAAKQRIGAVRVSYGGNMQAEVPLLAAEPMPKRTFLEALYQELVEPIWFEMRT